MPYVFLIKKTFNTDQVRMPNHDLAMIKEIYHHHSIILR